MPKKEILIKGTNDKTKRPLNINRDWHLQDKFSSISVPTMIVVGERDGKSSSRALEKIPTSTR